MRPPKKPSAIKPLLFLLAMAWGALACAAPVGTVTNLSGPLLVKKADGSKKILAQNSTVESGDTLITAKAGYAQVRFIDDSRMIFQPGTTLTIVNFSYDADRKENDRADFALAEGGVRLQAGALAKRSKDTTTVTTPAGKLDMHDASATVQFVAQTGMDKKIAAARAFIMASTAALDESLQFTRTDAPALTAIEPLMLAQVTVAPRPALVPPGPPVLPTAPGPTAIAPPKLNAASTPVTFTPALAAPAPAPTQTPAPVPTTASVPAPATGNAPTLNAASPLLATPAQAPAAAPVAAITPAAPPASALPIAVTPTPVVSTAAVVPTPAVVAAARAPGLYVQVLDGLIHVSNPAGTANFSAGQFGFTPSVTQPPVLLPVNPGIQFTPPPVFNTTATTSAATAPKSGGVDCIVQ